MNKNEAAALAETINAWPLPYVKAYVSRLGGEDRSSVMVTVSLDAPSTWSNGILENSRYAKMAFHSAKSRVLSEAVEFSHFSGHRLKKIRGFTTKDKVSLYKKVKGIEAALVKEARE